MATTDIELILKSTKEHPVLLSFAQNLFEPKEYVNEGKKSYVREANFIIDQDHPQVDEIKAKIRQAIAEKWPGENAPTIPVDRRPLRSGMVEDPDTGVQKERWDGYDGKLFISANRRLKAATLEAAQIEPNPIQYLDGIRGPDGKFVRLTEADGKLYSGAKVVTILKIYAYDGTKHGNPHRVNASIECVQFAGHGEAFGAKPVDADSMLDEVPGLIEDGFDDKPAGGASSGGSSADDLL